MMYCIHIRYICNNYMYVNIYIHILMQNINLYIYIGRNIDIDIFRLKQRKNPVLRERSRRFPTVILNTAWNGCDGSYTISCSFQERFRTVADGSGLYPFF